MRDIKLQRIIRGIPVDADRGIPVIEESVVIQNTLSGTNNVLNNVSYISANRQGPPSWVIRCLETNEVFASQAKTALDMGLPPNELSRHLNGALDDVRGFHFERLCMAA